nr:hypothetical protein CFP56_00185 [Quercus suber]
MANPPGTIYSQRLVLRLNDPDNDEDCWKLIRTYNDEGGELGGITRVGIKTPEDVRRRNRKGGPKQKDCTKSAAPEGLWHPVFLKDDNSEAGEIIGSISMSNRSTMP